MVNDKKYFYKIVTIIILALITCTSLFASNSYFAVGSPTAGGAAGVDVEFFYNPDTMQRLTFGFTENTSIEWLGDNGDLNNKGFSLGTQVMQGRGELARGKGNVNFYWVLNTNKSVTAKLYLNAPLREVHSSELLDWSIKFNSLVNGSTSSAESISSVYGKENAVPIFTRTLDSNDTLMMGYQPIEVFTDFAPVKIEDQSYMGTVGVIVEAN